MDVCLKAIFRCLCGSTDNQPPPRPTNEQTAYEDVYVPPVLTRPPHQQQQYQPTEQPAYPQPQQQPYPQPQPQPWSQPGPQQPYPQQQGAPPPQFHQPPPTSRPHHPASPPRVHSPDLNQLNQNNEQYKALRARANAEGDAMAQCFERSHAAYAAGDGAQAKELSNEGRAHQREMERLNAQASEWIFVENNKDSKPGEIDLHGLYVKEAIRYTDQAIQEARQRGDAKLNIIVGKGLHSAGGMAKLKPAIEELMQKNNLVAQLDEHNSGVLIVNLDGQPTGDAPILRPDDITRGLERKDEGCTIM